MNEVTLSLYQLVTLSAARGLKAEDETRSLLESNVVSMRVVPKTAERRRTRHALGTSGHPAMIDAAIERILYGSLQGELEFTDVGFHDKGDSHRSHECCRALRIWNRWVGAQALV